MNSKQETELELTFLVNKLPDGIENVEPSELTDIYVPEESEFPVLRLRQKGQKYEITKKVPIKESDYSSHIEQSIELSQEEFSALSKSSNRKVSKKRYALDIDGQPAEIDVFTENLAGLVLADFEFNSEDEKQSFEMPDFCLADVTQERFILGGQLAGQSYSDIEEGLSRFNYKPVIL